jgi:protein-tyrosine phosphatase
MQASPRLLPLVGAYNFRDLGGYPTRDGQLTRWGRLFRSDTLHELTQADLKVLRGIGLETVIDLRTGSEVERTGRGRLEHEPVRYFHLSVIEEDGGESRGIPAPTDGDVSSRYLWYLDIGRNALVEALSLIGDPASFPLVFHCAAGKDRTGVLAALTLDIVGVTRDVIVEDYVLTATRMELIVTRLLRVAGDKRSIEDLPASDLAVEAHTMEKFLNGLDEQHGGAREWALSAGVPSESLDAMSELLLGPTNGA